MPSRKDTIRRLLPLAIALGSAALAHAAQAEPGRVIEGRVVRVVDGDNIEVHSGDRTIEIRLAGIDAPERGQPWTRRAKQALSARVFGRPVRAIEVNVDRYGRLVGEVYADDVCVGCELVREGHVWVYRDYSQDPVLLELEADARAAGRGLWGLPERERIPPWEWRRGRRPQAAPATRRATRFTCGGKSRCSEMASCDEARFHLACGTTGLDGDGDGTPCEALCNP